MGALALDAGALIALDRNQREVVALIARAAERGDRLIVSAGALAQAMREPATQARLSRLVRQPTTDVVPLDRVEAVRVGRRLAVSGTSDIVDAHVVECAQRANAPVVTSDPDDLRVLGPNLRIVVI